MNLLRNFSFNSLVLILLVSCGQSSTEQQVLTSTNVENSITPVVVEKQDKEVIDFIQPYKAKLDEKMNVVIGNCPVQLDEGEYQSPLGNFIIDLILLQSEEVYEKPIDMAVVTNGGLRTPMPQGDVTVGNIFELMPFNNELVVLTLAGDSVMKMFEYAAERGNAVIAGAQYSVDENTPTNIIINGKALNVDSSYSLAVSDYLAGGGDKMSFLTQPIETYPLGILFRDAIIKHIKELNEGGKEIIGKLDDRVQIVN